LDELRAADNIVDDSDMLRSCNNFYDAIKAANEPITLGVSSMSRLTFLLKLFQMKVINRATCKLMFEALEFIRELLSKPKGFPESGYDAKK
jgi:hypothetical protein